MQSFNLRALSQWVDWPMMTPLTFDTDGAESRACRVMIIADAPVRVYAVTDDDYQPVALASGMFELAFTAGEATSLAWVGEKRLDPDGKAKTDPLVRVLSMSRSQMMDGDDQDSFVVIEPRGSVQSDQMRRIQRLMMINMERRIKQQMEAMQASLTPPVTGGAVEQVIEEQSIAPSES